MKLLSLRSLLLVFFFFIVSANCSAEIVLKLVGANPSKEQKQSLVLKAYLPVEVSMDDVLDSDGLKLIYDTKESAYYVFGEQELEPGEVVEKSIHLRDVWVIDQNKIDSIREEAKNTLEFLTSSEHKERARFLSENIQKRLDEIEFNQNKDYVNPQQHISIYRDNIKKFASVKEDLVIIRSLLSQVKRLPSVQIMKLIFIVVGFLTFLSVALYFIWHRQSNEFE